MRKNGEYRICLKCGKQFYKQLSRIKIGKGRYCSSKCAANYPKSKATLKRMSLAQIGKVSPFRGKHRPELAGSNHWNWKGGLSKTSRLDDVDWDIVRKIVYQRDNWSCRSCGQKCHNNIQCHHLIPYRRCNGQPKKSIFWNILIDDPANLVTLCKSCHIVIEKGVVKREKEGDYGFQTILHMVPTV